MSNKSNLNTNEEMLYNYNKTLLGCTYPLDLNQFQQYKINQFLGCLRKVKNNKIAQINFHNQQYLNFQDFNLFKEKNPNIPSNKNPYKYIYPNQGYASSKELGMEFIGPLQEEVYSQIYKNNKHYLERVPSELYRNSIQDLFEGNNKYIADAFNKDIKYINKRKPLKFIKKNNYTESFLVTKSDKMFTIKGNYIYFGKHFDIYYPIEQQIKQLNKQLKSNKSLSNKDKLNLEKEIAKLQIKLDKDISYLGKLKITLSKVNKSTKKIDYNSINSIRIKRDKNRYSVSFSYEYINEYIPCLLRLDNGKEIISKDELSLYIKELSDINPQLALNYLRDKVLGLDRGVLERLAASQNINLSNNKDNRFLSYSEEIKLTIEKLKRKIAYHNRQLKRRTKDSKGYIKSLNRYRKLNRQLVNIRRNENHQVSHKIVNDLNYPIIALEKLNLKGMTKKAMPKINIEKTLKLKHNVNLNLSAIQLNELVEKVNEYNKENKQGLKYKEIVKDYKIIYNKNNAAAKSGLNESMLNQNHRQLGEFLEYKSAMYGKIVIEVPAAYSSQECSECGNINSKSRMKTKFCCVKCGYKEHADLNASRIITGRVYKELLNHAETYIKKEAVNKTKLTKKSKLLSEEYNLEEIIV